jgi:hypothetical protein
VLGAVGKVHGSMPLKEIRGENPSPPSRGEREGPAPKAWEGEVGGAANQHVGPPHPTLSPGRRVEREKRGQLPKLSLTKNVERQEGADDEVRHVD